MNSACDATASSAETAVTLWEKENSILEFCGHHSDMLGPSLITAGWTLVADMRDE